MPVSASSTPWMPYLTGTRGTSALQSLSAEIRACGDWLGPTAEEHERRLLFVECLKRKLKLLYPWSELVTFGSLMTKLYLPDGDIDVAVIWLYGKPVQDSEHPFDPSSRLISDIWPIFQWHYFPGDVAQVPDTTSRPHAKLTRTQTAFQRQIRNSNEGGGRAITWINKQLKIRPYMRPFIMVVKAWVSQNGLNTGWSGGMNCYCLIVLIVSFFQLHPSIPESHAEIELELGELLVQFFAYYGGVSAGEYATFCCDKGVSVLGQGALFDPRERGWLKPDMEQLHVEDPCDINNNLGAGIVDVEKIRHAFRKTHDVLMRATQNKKPEGPFESQLQAILGYDEEYIARRAALSKEYPLDQLRAILGSMI